MINESKCNNENILYIAESGRGYRSLKSHNFFRPISWSDLGTSVPPYVPDASTFPPTSGMRDGASDEWLEEGEATPIQPENPIKFSVSSMSAASDIPTEEASVSKWHMFLEPNEKQLFTGMVWKRKVIKMKLLIDLHNICLNWALTIGSVLKKKAAYFNRQTTFVLCGS